MTFPTPIAQPLPGQLTVEVYAEGGYADTGAKLAPFNAEFLAANGGEVIAQLFAQGYDFIRETFWTHRENGPGLYPRLVSQSAAMTVHKRDALGTGLASKGVDIHGGAF